MHCRHNRKTEQNRESLLNFLRSWTGSSCGLESEECWESWLDPTHTWHNTNWLMIHDDVWKIHCKLTVRHLMHLVCWEIFIGPTCHVPEHPDNMERRDLLVGDKYVDQWSGALNGDKHWNISVYICVNHMQLAKKYFCCSDLVWEQNDFKVKIQTVTINFIYTETVNRKYKPMHDWNKQ